MTLRSEDGRPLKSKNPTVIGKDGTTLLEAAEPSSRATSEPLFPHWASPLLILAGGIGLAFGVFFLWLIASFLGIFFLLNSSRTPKRRAE